MLIIAENQEHLWQNASKRHNLNNTTHVLLCNVWVLLVVKVDSSFDIFSNQKQLIFLCVSIHWHIVTHLVWSSLVKVMACRLFLPKPLLKPIWPIINWTPWKKTEQNTKLDTSKNAFEMSFAKWWTFWPVKPAGRLIWSVHICDISYIYIIMMSM